MGRKRSRGNDTQVGSHSVAPSLVQERIQERIANLGLHSSEYDVSPQSPMPPTEAEVRAIRRALRSAGHSGVPPKLLPDPAPRQDDRATRTERKTPRFRQSRSAKPEFAFRDPVLCRLHFRRRGQAGRNRAPGDGPCRRCKGACGRNRGRNHGCRERRDRLRRAWRSDRCRRIPQARWDTTPRDSRPSLQRGRWWPTSYPRASNRHEFLKSLVWCKSMLEANGHTRVLRERWFRRLGTPEAPVQRHRLNRNGVRSDDGGRRCRRNILDRVVLAAGKQREPKEARQAVHRLLPFAWRAEPRQNPNPLNSQPYKNVSGDYPDGGGGTPRAAAA